jgi:hypothetical protein
VNKRRYRPGQALAHECAYERVVAGWPYTALVLPTRYGKSDLMRMLALDLWKSKIVAVTLAVSPNVLLRGQLGGEKEFKKALSRYEVCDPDLKIVTIDRPGLRFNANGEFFVSVTMQLFERNVDLFVQWAESVFNATGLPIVLMVDECHTGSESNSWGEAVRRMASDPVHRDGCSERREADTRV